MKSFYTAKELAEMGGMPGTERAVQLKAKRENWPFQARSGKGGGREYAVEALPEETRLALAGPFLLPVQSVESGRQSFVNRGQIDFSQRDAKKKSVPSPPVPSGSHPQTCRAVQEGKANIKASLVRLYLQHLAGAAWGHKEQARDNFMVLYNSGSKWPELFQELGELSWKTVEGWKTKLKKSCGDSLQLADRRGKQMGARRITPVQAGIILSFVRQPKGKSLPKSEIIRFSRDVMRGKGMDDLSDASYRRFLDDWISVNYDEWIWWREGDKGLNDKCLFWTERDYDQINVGDILVADGHVLNFLIRNPWTGKDQRMMLVLFFDMKSSMPCGWEIMPTESTMSISSALRRSIIRLGMTPKIVYLDNGRAFKGQYFTGTDFEQTELPGLYDRLGIRLIVAKPYHGQSKTIERFFKTFGELERMSPSFIGTAIDTKPAHLNRGEKLHRAINDQISGGFVPTLIDSHRAISAWFDAYAARPQGPGSHLAGICPQELFDAGRGPGVDPEALRVLMMKKEERTIYGRGVKVYDKGDWYYHPALYGRKHKVFVRFDLQERDSVLVYDQRNDEFICEAERVDKVHPAAAILGDSADQALLRGQLELAGALRKQTIAHAKDMAEQVVIPEAQRLIEESCFGSPEGKAAPGAKGTVIKMLPEKPAPRLTHEELQREIEESQRLQDEFEVAQEAAKIARMDEDDRYGYLLDMEMRGESLNMEYRRFMRTYEAEMAPRDVEYWEGQRSVLATMHRKTG